MKKTLVALTLAIGFLATGCGSSSGGSPAVGTNNSTSLSGNTTNDVSNSTQNTTTNNTGNSTGGTGANNTATTNTTAPAAPSGNVAVSSPGQAVAIVSQMYAAIKAKDSNLTVMNDHTTQQDGHTVYVIHVFDNMTDHIATVAWINVRDDGKVENGLTPNGWVAPSQYPVS